MSKVKYILQIIFKVLGIAILIGSLWHAYDYFFVDSSHDIHDISQGKIELHQQSAMAGEWFYFKVKIDEPFEVTTYPKVDHSNIRIEGKIVKIKMPNKSIKVNVIPSETETHQHDNKQKNDTKQEKALDDNKSDNNITESNDSISTTKDTLFWVNKTVERYTVKNGIKVIWRNAFRNCQNITKITIPNSVVEIYDEAFCYCENLKEIKLPPSLKKIGKKIFAYCNVLKQIEIPENIETIDDNPFYKIENNLQIKSRSQRFIIINNALIDNMNSKLISYNGKDNIVTIPNGVKIIGNYAFANNRHIKTIRCSSVTKIMDYAFCNCSNIEEFDFPNVDNIGLNPFFGIHNSPSINLNNKKFLLRNNILIDKEKDKLICYVGNDTIVDLYIHNLPIDKQIKTIGTLSFYDCGFIKRIKLPDSIKQIEQKAFLKCVLTLICPNSIKNDIDNYISNHYNTITTEII